MYGLQNQVKNYSPGKCASSPTKQQTKITRDTTKKAKLGTCQYSEKWPEEDTLSWLGRAGTVGSHHLPFWKRWGRTSPMVRQAGGKVRVWVPEWQYSSNKPTIQKAGWQPPAVSTQSSKISTLGLPWWSSGFKTLCSQHWGHRFNPWSGN